LKEFSQRGVQYKVSWKDTYRYNRCCCKKRHRMEVEEELGGLCFKPHRPLAMRGVYSNYLHRPWTCHSIDLESACPGFLRHCDVTVVSQSELSIDRFVECFERPNIPVVITGSSAINEGLTNKWTREYLVDQLGPSRLRATSATCSVEAGFTAEEYFQYAAQAREEAPLYLFER
jgi:hypothetical protein